jgi:TolB-like protein/class 3 adenylate cyclase
LTKKIDTERRLVAIFAADVEGYSRLMGADEVGTLRALTQQRSILDGFITSHRGRIANTAGDSVLAEFGSAVDAVQCAVEAQEALAEANARVSPDRRHLNFRIGVHVGDVMVKGGDLFGDGVNIAARLQTIASAGGVCISGMVYDQVRKLLPFAFTDLGAQQVKNIEEPVRAFTVAAKDIAAVNTMQLALPDKPSIAILPFQNMSGDPEQEYVADGMVEDITTALSRNTGLFVISRNSCFTYKGKAIDVKQVGRDLGVRYVLEGSVRKLGNKVRITGQLIDVSTNAHLWADRFDGAAEDLFGLQDQVASSVIGAIAPKIELAEINRSARKTDNFQAYDYYLRGLSHVYRFTKEGNQEAMSLFEKAIALDPKFAIAHAGIAGLYIAAKAMAWKTISPQEMIKVGELAQKLQELGSDDARVIAPAGQALSFVLGRVEEGAVLLHQAIILDPNFATARLWLGGASLYLGELDISQAQYRTALRLSPRDPRIFLAQSGLANVYFLSGELDEASKWAVAAVRQSPKFAPGHRIAMACFAFAGKVYEARRECEITLQLDPSLRISGILERTPFRRPEHIKKYEEAFRIAGVPE